MTPLEKEYIEFEKSKVRVEAYDNVVMNKSFKGRTRGLWAGIALGLASGLALGALAAVLPALIGVAEFGSITAASVITCGAIGGATGTGIGILGGQIIGASASAAASAAAEKERREKVDSLEQRLAANPNLPELAAQYSAQKESGTLEHPVPPSANTVGEAWNRSKNMGDFIKQVFVPKAMLTAIGFGAVLGAALGLAAAAGASAPMLGPLLSHAGVEVPKLAAGQALASNWPSIVAASSAITASVASIFGLNYPMAFASLADFSGKILSGKIFEKNEGRAPEQVKEQVIAMSQTPPAYAMENPAHKTQKTTYSQMILDQKTAERPEGVVLH